MAALSLYSHASGFSMEILDEDNFILRNVGMLVNPANISRVLLSDPFFNTQGVDHYRPMQNLSFMLNAQISGSRPYAYRFTNLLLHWLTCCALFHLLTLLGLNRLISLAAALLCCVHPLFTSAVIWLSSRGDLLLALLSIVSLISLIRLLENPGYKYLVLHLVSFALAVFCKETALVFPLIACFYMVFFRGRKVPVRLYASLAAGYVLILAANLVLRNLVLQGRRGENEFGLGILLGNAAVLPETVAKFFFPVHLSLMSSFSAAVTVAGCLVLAVLLVLAVRMFSRQPQSLVLGGLGLVWFLLFTVPGMMYRYSLVGASYDYLEHRAYLPMIGMVIFLGSLLPRGWDAGKNRSWLLWAGAVACLFAAVAFRYAQSFKNPLSFYAQAIESNPGNSLALYNRGRTKLAMGNVQEAIADFSASIEHTPNYPYPYFNRGSAYGMTGRYQESLADLNRGLQLRSDYPDGHFNRALTYLMLKDYSSALADLNAVIRLRPDDASAHFQRGVAKQQLQDMQGACADWRAASALGEQRAWQPLQLNCR